MSASVRTFDDPVELEILWSRLISIVDESATTLKRTSFSTVVRESNDYAVALIAADGSTLTENTLGVPSFAGLMSRVTRETLARYPLDTWRPGDAVITNDPWLNTGHLPDTTIVVPIFYRDQLVAFAVNCAHKTDIGGRGYSGEAHDVLEEGLWLPFVKLADEGVLNEQLLRLIRGNVRLPDEFFGDLDAQLAAAHVCRRGVQEFMAEEDLTELVSIGAAMSGRAESAMRAAITELPDGRYSFEVETDGFDHPLTIACTVIVEGDGITVDFEGTSPQVPKGVNAVYNYTYAFACYTVKCVLDSETPKSEGSYRPITVVAPEGCVLNAKYPAAVHARSMTGHVVSSAILGALSKAAPERVIADSGSCPGLRLNFSGMDAQGRRFVQLLFQNGGMGASSGGDGLSCTGFPTNAGGGSLEVAENLAPLIFWDRGFITDSGGPGRQRGGLGQKLEIEYVGPETGMLRSRFDRIDHPAKGLFGGLPGAPSQLRLNGDQQVPGKGVTPVKAGDVLTVHYAGGGGFGDPTERRSELVERDVKNELVSAEAAKELYGYQPESE